MAVMDLPIMARMGQRKNDTYKIRCERFAKIFVHLEKNSTCVPCVPLQQKLAFNAYNNFLVPFPFFIFATKKFLFRCEFIF